MTPWLVRMIAEHHHRDDDDRPLREIRTPPALLRADDIEHKPCPYPGSRARSGCPMNVSALRQMSSHWSDIVDALALVRQRHAATRGQRPPDLMDLWRVSQLAASLPWFFILRGDAATRAPGFAAALAKATQGVGIWAQRVLVDALTGVAPPATWTAQAILDSAEANGTLVGEREACAGPDAMMRRFFDTLIDGTPELSSPTIAALARDGAAVQTFGAHYGNLKLVLWLHALARQFVYADVVAALGADHPSCPAVRALADDGCDPPDFFLVLPGDPAALAPADRAAWLGGLATLVVPFAADGSDQTLAAIAAAIARAGLESEAPSTLVDEVTVIAGVAASAAPRLAQAIATFARLDTLLGAAATVVEAGFRGTAPDAAPAPPFDAATRDRLLAAPPRAILRGFAPVGFDALCAT